MSKIADKRMMLWLLLGQISPQMSKRRRAIITEKVNICLTLQDPSLPSYFLLSTAKASCSLTPPPLQVGESSTLSRAQVLRLRLSGKDMHKEKHIASDLVMAGKLTLLNQSESSFKRVSSFLPYHPYPTNLWEKLSNLFIKEPQAQINRFGGLMTPEYVAEGFFQLVTKGGNGSCMLVLNNTPYLMVKNKQADFNH